MKRNIALLVAAAMLSTLIGDPVYAAPVTDSEKTAVTAESPSRKTNSENETTKVEEIVTSQLDGERTGADVPEGLDLTITGGTLNEDYTFSNNVITIQSGKKMTISGTTSENSIVISANTAARLVLDGVSIDLTKINDLRPHSSILLKASASLTLTLAENSENLLTGGNNRGGAIEVPGGTELILDGAGKLTANGGYESSGIGGRSSTTGSITIRNGIISANGGSNAAGIGGSFDKAGGNVTITGGTVTATGNYGAAGIGGGRYGDGGTVTITGGTVTALGGCYAAGIGGRNAHESASSYGAGADVTITGGTVTAIGGIYYDDEQASGIGRGYGCTGDRGTTTITGGSVRSIGNTEDESIKRSSDSVSTNDLYLTTVSLCSLSSAAAVSDLTCTAAYGIKDMQTDEKGELYLWLPEGSKTTAVTAGAKNYVGEIVTTAPSASGTLRYPVNIPVTTDSTKRIRTYAGTAFDITDLFTLDANWGTPTYQLGQALVGEILTGEGSLTEDGVLTVTKPGTFKIVVETAESGDYAKGTASAVLYIAKGSQSAPDASVVTTHFGSETISYTDSYEVNTTSDFGGTAIANGSTITDYIADAGETEHTLYVRKKENVLYNSGDVTAVTISQRPAAPTGITTEEPSNYGKNDGKITGVTTAMEYRAFAGESASAAGSWIPVTDTTITGLAPGHYEVRLKSTDSAFTGMAVNVEVRVKRGANDLTTGTIASIKAQNYTGRELTPAITVKYGKVTLEQDADYTVTYSNNKNVGTAQVTVTGCGDYYGELTKDFTIQPKAIKTGFLQVSDLVETGTALKPSVRLMDGAVSLTEGTDFEVYNVTDNTKPGKAKFKVKGIGNYKGTLNGSFQIYKAGTQLLGTCELTLNGTPVPEEGILITGKAIKPEVVIKDVSGNVLAKSNYQVTYKNNKNAGTATVQIKGKGKNFKGTILKYFTILPQNITSAYQLEKVADKTFTGSVTKQKPQVKLINGKKKLTAGRDYVITYENAVNAGSAIVIVTGIGNYTGTLSKSFAIQTKDLSKGVKVTKNKVQADPTSPVLKVTYGKRVLVKDRDYSVTYDTATKSGKVIVSLTGIGNYTGTLTKTFKM